MKRNTMKKEDEEIKEEDIIGEVKVTIAKDAFQGPFTCCGMKTKRAKKQSSFRGLEFTHEVWRCKKCGKEYLDTQQAGSMEKFWELQMLFEGNSPTMERTLNYDGKAYFVRFPKDLTSTWARQKKEKARLTMLSPDRYLVEVT